MRVPAEDELLDAHQPVILHDPLDHLRTAAGRRVPAPPRTSPIPAHRFGATSGPSVRPPCSVGIRRCPSDSLRAGPARTARIASGPKPSSGRRAPQPSAAVT
ncbi:hypothetical protein K7396_05580 [Streptomyces angustmyceticus]|nr:hypothetical protein K7396_05580 [Streptomyces angustmyceticus]